MYTNNSSGDFFLMLFVIFMALMFLSLMRSLNKKNSSATTTATQSTSKVEKDQMAEDIRATKTSQVSDAIAILDDLGSTNSNYRHYCELVGSAMPTGGVVAPYSKRQVAYYDIRCYRIDSTYGGGTRETLVAHEHSIDPFYFKDASCDTPVYVDLESFGGNVILVNSTNHVEGPNSDFSKAFQKKAASATSSGTSGAYAMVAQALSFGANALLGAMDTLRRGLTPRPAFQPALALAGGGTMTSSEALGSNFTFAQARGVTSGRGGGQGRGGQSHGGQSYTRGPQPRINVSFGYGPSRPPQHLDDFLGGFSGPWVMGGGGYYHRPRPTTDPSDVILGMGLGALLNSMNTTQQQVATAPQDTFMGYRLVENVVPLNSPIYCIGEIYRSGTNVYMSHSLSKDYPTSYFATKPETEVLSEIESK